MPVCSQRFSLFNAFLCGVFYRDEFFFLGFYYHGVFYPCQTSAQEKDMVKGLASE